MTRRALVLLAAVFMVALAGCAPNTDAAYKRCFDTLTLTANLDDTLTSDERIAQMIEVAEVCRAAAKADPAGFNQQWNE
jgi:hypothetical protein